MTMTINFLDASLHLYKWVCPSVRPLVRRMVRNASVKIAENGKIQDGDASYVVYTALLDASSHLYKRVCPSVGPSPLFSKCENMAKSRWKLLNIA